MSSVVVARKGIAIDTPARELQLHGLQRVSGTPMVVMVLREIDGARSIEIGMGPNDAWKIMGVLEERSLRKRTSGDADPSLSFFFFLEQLMKKVGAKIERVVITGYDGAMWKAKMSLKGPDGEGALVCRASDGVAVGIAANAKLLATDVALNYRPN